MIAFNIYKRNINVSKTLVFDTLFNTPEFMGVLCRENVSKNVSKTIYFFKRLWHTKHYK